jgi:predicted nucleotidyltransferase
MSIKNEVLEYLRENKKYFYEKYGIKSIKLFGSVARGEDNENSDIDLLIEFKDFKSANLRNYMGFIEEVKNVFKRKIDVATNEMIKPLLWKYIKRDLIEG